MNRRGQRKLLLYFIVAMSIAGLTIFKNNHIEIKAAEETQNSCIELRSNNSFTEDSSAIQNFENTSSEGDLTLFERAIHKLEPIQAEMSELPKSISSTKAVTRNGTVDVSDWVEFINALSNVNAGTINITADFEVPIDYTGGLDGVRSLGKNASGGLAYLWLTTNSISREVIIEGNGHEIDFKAVAISMDPKTVNDLSPWGITLKNLNIYHGNYYGFANFTGLTNAQAVLSTITYEDVKNVGNQMIHSPYGIVEIKGDTSSLQQEYYTSKAGEWQVNKINQTNMYISNLTVKEDAVFTVATIDAGNIELVSNKPGDLVLEKNAVFNATANGTSHSLNEASGTNLFVKQGNVILGEGAQLNLSPQANSSAITLSGSGATLTVGERAQININSNGFNSNKSGSSYNLIWMAKDSSLVVGEEGSLNINATGMEASTSNIIHIAGNAQFVVKKQGVFDVRSDSSSPSQNLLYFGSSGSIFLFADAKRVNLQRTTPISTPVTMITNGLINMYGNGGGLVMDIQKVKMWERENFSETPNVSWTPINGMYLIYSGITSKVTSVSSMEQSTIDSFASTFTTKNRQRVLFESIPDVTVKFKTQAVDLPSNPYARKVQGTTNPGAYVRIVDSPVNDAVEPTILSNDHKIVSPVTASGQPDLLTGNYTVRADATGNFSFLIPNVRRGFSAGSTIELFSFSNGKYGTATQVVLDTTAPAGEEKECHFLKGAAVPNPQEFVHNPTDTNPDQQDFTYAYSKENSVDQIASMMNTIGDYDIKVDLFDNAGNKATISSKLVIHEQANEIDGEDFELGIEILRSMDTNKLREQILTLSGSFAHTIVEGQLTDLTNDIQITDLDGLTATAPIGVYQVTLTVKKGVSGLTVDIEKVINVTIVNDKTILTLNFVNEVGTVLYTDSLEKSAGEIVDLTKEQIVLDGKAFMAERKYQLVQGPTKEKAYVVPTAEKTILYKFTGGLFIESCPTTIEFGTQKIGIFDKKVKKADFDLPCILGDNRANKGNWTLTVAVEQTLTHQSDTERSLPGSIKYRIDGEHSVILSDEVQPIASFGDSTVIESDSLKDKGTKFYNVSQSWGEGESGFELEISARSILKLGEYKATILWQLEEVPERMADES